MPQTHKIGHNFKQGQHCQFNRGNGTVETGTGHHPVAMIRAIQASNNKFHRGTKVKATELRRRHPLLATLHQAQVDDWIVDNYFVSAHRPNTQLIHLCLSQRL